MPKDAHGTYLTLGAADDGGHCTVPSWGWSPVRMQYCNDLDDQKRQRTKGRSNVLCFFGDKQKSKISHRHQLGQATNPICSSGQPYWPMEDISDDSDESRICSRCNTVHSGHPSPPVKPVSAHLDLMTAHSSQSGQPFLFSIWLAARPHPATSGVCTETTSRST